MKEHTTCLPPLAIRLRLRSHPCRVRTSIQGPWELQFPKNLGAPDHVTLDRLISWTEHPDPGVKYFSGTATYRIQFTLHNGIPSPDRRLFLDLGRVCVIAEVLLNGHDL